MWCGSPRRTRFERDGLKPNAWQYRDYVIASFNKDKPYDQFVREQIAGDELDDATPETHHRDRLLPAGGVGREPSDGSRRGSTSWTTSSRPSARGSWA